MPDCVVGIDEIKKGKPLVWESYCLDYSIPEVRNHMLELIVEQADLYGDILHGFQLDWMRFPRHLSGTPDEVWGKRRILTQFTRDVRATMKRGGRNLLLSARVPTSPAGCRRLGLDIEAWGSEGLLDILVPCPFLSTEWQMPIAQMKALLKNANIQVIGGFDMGFGPDGHFPESLRGICSNLYDLGSDGVYIFKFPCWISSIAARPYHWLTGLDNPKTAAAKPVLFAVEHSKSKMKCVDNPGQLPTRLADEETCEFTIFIPRTALTAWRALLLVHSYGDISLTVNGNDAVSVRFGMPYRSLYRNAIFMNSGAPPHLKPVEQLETMDSDNCRVMKIDPYMLKPGANKLRVGNLSGRELEIERLHLGLW